MGIWAVSRDAEGLNLDVVDNWNCRRGLFLLPVGQADRLKKKDLLVASVHLVAIGTWEHQWHAESRQSLVG